MNENKQTLSNFTKKKHEWIYPVLYALYYYILPVAVGTKPEYQGIYAFLAISVIYISIEIVSNRIKRKIDENFSKKDFVNKDNIRMLLNKYIQLHCIIVFILLIYVIMIQVYFLVDNSFIRLVQQQFYGKNAYLEVWLLASCILDIYDAIKISRDFF
ncbi:MAG: hypothetical protein RR198_05780 [Oscillospiraceae bacterium]